VPKPPGSARKLPAAVTPSCRICGASAARCDELAPLPFSRCLECGFVFRDRADVHELYERGSYEGSHGGSYTEDDDARRRDARVRLSWLKSFAPGGRLLDVGAAGGAFVVEAAEAGYDAWGIEPTPAFAAHARDAFGVDVRAATLEDTPLERESLDVVTMWHVLEHVPEPVAQLRRVAAALRPGGVVAIEVPNYGSAVSARMGRAWPSLEPDVHVSQFAPPTLRAALQRAELLPETVETLPITPYLTPPGRLNPRHVAARLKAAVWLRTPQTHHPRGHELLRAVGRRSGPGSGRAK
jgi:SAM-dependent methyltransferase